MFESVSKRQPRLPLRLKIALVIAAPAIAAVALHIWHRQNDPVVPVLGSNPNVVATVPSVTALESSSASLIPEEPPLEAAARSIEMPGGMSVVMSGKFTITGDAREGHLDDDKGSWSIDWTSSPVAGAKVSLDALAEHVEADASKAGQSLTRADVIRVDGREGRYLVFQRAAESTQLVITLCGNRALRFATAGRGDMEAMLKSFHCGKAS